MRTTADRDSIHVPPAGSTSTLAATGGANPTPASNAAPLFAEYHLAEVGTTSDAWVDEILDEIRGRRSRPLVVDPGRLSDS